MPTPLADAIAARPHAQQAVLSVVVQAKGPSLALRLTKLLCLKLKFCPISILPDSFLMNGLTRTGAVRKPKPPEVEGFATAVCRSLLLKLDPCSV